MKYNPEGHTSQNPARSNEAEAEVEVLLAHEKIQAQIPLMRMMVPAVLKEQPSFIGVGENFGVIEDELFTLWTEKYAEIFSDFCVANKDDIKLIKELKACNLGGCNLSTENLERIEEHLVKLGGSFIENPEAYLVH